MLLSDLWVEPNRGRVWIGREELVTFHSNVRPGLGFAACFLDWTQQRFLQSLGPNVITWYGREGPCLRCFRAVRVTSIGKGGRQGSELHSLAEGNRKMHVSCRSQPLWTVRQGGSWHRSHQSSLCAMGGGTQWQVGCPMACCSHPGDSVPFHLDLNVLDAASVYQSISVGPGSVHQTNMVRTCPFSAPAVFMQLMAPVAYSL